MLRVGLTGGIGSGKSAVARQLAARGAVVIDADVLAREVVAPGTPGLAAVVEAFGPRVVQADGSLDRGWLADVVFADPDARARLEAIVHPAVRERAAAVAAEAPTGAIVIHDVPLLVESGLASSYDVVVVVETPPAIRLDRLVGSRGMTPERAQARIDSQASDERRREVADIVVDNSGGLADLAVAVDGLWVELVAREATVDQGPAGAEDGAL